jgi:cell division protein FtsL
MQNLEPNNYLKKIGISFTLLVLSIFCFGSYDSLKVRKSILALANKISKYKTIDDGAIGYAGEMSQQYKQFKNLLEIATDNELIILTDNKNENVRVYSFWALAKRSYKGITTILEKHLHDSAKIDFLVVASFFHTK